MLTTSLAAAQRHRTLTLADLRLLAGVTVLEIALAISLRVLRLQILRRSLRPIRPVAAWLVEPSEGRLLSALDRTARRLPFARNCLVRALMAELILGSCEPPLCVTIGVRRSAGRLEAHAWVEHEGRVLVGEVGVSASSVRAAFVPLLTWKSARA